MLEEMHPLHPEQSTMLNSIVQDSCCMDFVCAVQMVGEKREWELHLKMDMVDMASFLNAE